MLRQDYVDKQLINVLDTHVPYVPVYISIFKAKEYESVCFVYSHAE